MLRLLWGLSLASVLCSGQNKGSIQSTVMDQSGAVITNAQIVLRAAKTGMPMHETKADRNGHFVLADVGPGVYEMKVSSPGFQTLVQQVRISGDRDVMLPGVLLKVSAAPPCAPQLGAPRIGLEEIGGPETILQGSVHFDGPPTSRISLSLSMGAGKKQRLMPEIDPKGTFFVQRTIPDGFYSLRMSAPGYADFIIDPIILKPGHKTQVGDPLEMKRCPSGVRCAPNKTVPLPTICL